ncbi:MAG TPA: hypothetical protein VI072_29265 [Polyangiaceae bacterium]
MKRARIGILAAGVLCATALPGACSVYDESLLGSGGGGPDSSTGCLHARWPDEPKNAPPGGDISFVTALTYFDFGEPYVATDGGANHPYRDVGYDLDNTCTKIGPGDPRPEDPNLNQDNSCRNAGGPGFAGVVGDYKDGRDNGLAGLITRVKLSLQEFGTDAYLANIGTGKVSLLFGVSGYNGELNDDDVTGIIYSPAAFDSVPENAGKTPQFDGSDRWPIMEDSYVGENEAEPAHKSIRGYVTNGVLVARTADLNLRLRIGISSQDVTDLQITFLQPFLTAKISKDERGLWQLTEGVIAGRWKTDDLFKELSRFPNPDTYPDVPVDDPFFCTDSQLYPAVRGFICSLADIYSGPPGPGNDCDSLSIGIAFNAIQAQLGPKVETDDRVNPCGVFNPADDDCAKWARGEPVPGAGQIEAGAGDGGS